MYSQKLALYQFVHKKLIASLYISKHLNPALTTLPTFLNVTVAFNTLKIFDVNLLTINALLFLVFGQYPKPIFKKKLAKYRKSKITFMLTFSKKNSLYFYNKLYLLFLSRQTEFVGYTYKTVFLIVPQQVYSFPIKTLLTFYMIDYLYGQQTKSILTVKQQFTLNVNCCFNNSSFFTMDYLRLMNLPLFFDSLLTEEQKKNLTVKQELEESL